MFQSVSYSGVEEGKDDGFQVEEGKQMTETIVIFDNNQFLLYDFKENKSWQVGDVEGAYIPEDAQITMIDNEKHRTNACQAILTGGF